MGNGLLKGVNAYGVKTPLIQIGDDLKKIVESFAPLILRGGTPSLR